MLKQPYDNLISGPISKSLLKLAVPMIIAFGFQTSFNFVDRYFVSRLGDIETAAIGMAFIIQLIIIAVGAGVGVGLNSFISRNLGAGKQEKAVSAALHSFVLAIVIGLGICFIGLLTQKAIFQSLGAEGKLLESITSYLTIIFYFTPIILLAMLSNNIFRGWGNTVYPMKFMLTGTFLNIVLDPVFIFGWWFIPAYGIKGAALATGISRCLALLYTLFILFVKSKPVELHFKNFKLDERIFKGIFQVGLPASGGQIMTSFTMSLIFLILDRFGNYARAAYTIAFTYEMVAFLPVIGIGQAIAIMTGHNYGAQHYARIRKIYFRGIFWSVILMSVISITILFDPGFFASVFARSKTVLTHSTDALRILAPGYMFNGIFLCTISSFQGLGLGNHQFSATIIRLIIFIVPLAYFGSLLWNLNGVWIGILSANGMIALLMLLWYRYLYYKKLIRGKVMTM